MQIASTCGHIAGQKECCSAPWRVQTHLAHQPYPVLLPKSRIRHCAERWHSARRCIISKCDDARTIGLLVDCQHRRISPRRAAATSARVCAARLGAWPQTCTSIKLFSAALVEHRRLCYVACKVTTVQNGAVRRGASCRLSAALMCTLPLSSGEKAH